MRFLQPLRNRFRLFTKEEERDINVKDNKNILDKRIFDVDSENDEFHLSPRTSLSYEEYILIINSVNKILQEKSSQKSPDCYGDILKISHTSGFSDIEASFFYNWLDCLIEIADKIDEKKEGKEQEIIKISYKLDSLLAAFRILSDPVKRSKYDEEIYNNLSLEDKKQAEQYTFSLLESESRDEGNMEGLELLSLKHSRSGGSVNSHDIATLFSSVHSTLSNEEEELNEEKYDVLLLNSVTTYHGIHTSVNDSDRDRARKYEKMIRKVKLLVNTIQNETSIGMTNNDDDSLGQDSNRTKEDTDEEREGSYVLEGPHNVDEVAVQGEEEQDNISIQDDDSLIREYYMHSEELRRAREREERRTEQRRRREKALEEKNALEKKKREEHKERIRKKKEKEFQEKERKILEMEERKGFLSMYKEKKNYPTSVGVVKRAQKKKRQIERKGFYAKKKNAEKVLAREKGLRKEDDIIDPVRLINAQDPYLHNVESLANCVADLGESMYLAYKCVKDYFAECHKYGDSCGSSVNSSHNHHSDTDIATERECTNDQSSIGDTTRDDTTRYGDTITRGDDTISWGENTTKYFCETSAGGGNTFDQEEKEDEYLRNKRELDRKAPKFDWRKQLLEMEAQCTTNESNKSVRCEEKTWNEQERRSATSRVSFADTAKSSRVELRE